MRFDKLKKQLTRHEGYRRFAYKCSGNKITVGIGRNLEDRGLSKDEADFLLENDVTEIYEELEKLAWFQGLNSVRQDVILNMAFNLGIEGLLKFRKTISYLKERDWEKAGEEMLNSKWAGQVGNRAYELSDQMKGGKYII